MPEFDEFSDAAPEPSDDGHLGAVFENLHADQPYDGENGQALPPATGQPQSWSAAMRQRLSALPPDYRDVVEYIAKRDREQSDAISRAGQERKQLEPLRKLIHESGLPEDMPIEEAVRHLEGAFGQGDAAKHMRELAESYKRDYEPLKSVLDQHQDTFQHYGMQPHEAIQQLLRMERMLRDDPNAVVELAKAYGRELPTADHVTKLQGQLSEAAQAESKRALDEFMKDKEYFNDTNFQSAIAAEMRALQKDAPGLKGTALLKLAHGNVAERAGIPKQLEQHREQEQQQRQAQRDDEWKQFIMQRDADQMRREQERDAQRQRENQEKTRWAKRAAAVNTRGSPGHGTNPKTMDHTLREIANRVYG